MLEITYWTLKDLHVLLVIVRLLNTQLFLVGAFYCEETIDEEPLADESASSANVLLDYL
jgi:hypothetical protein